MTKTIYRIQMIIFLASLFMIGIGLFDLINNGLKTGKELVWQISYFVPFILLSISSGIRIYSKTPFTNQ